MAAPASVGRVTPYQEPSWPAGHAGPADRPAAR